MFQILDITKGNTIAFEAKETIEKADYEKLDPILEMAEENNEKVDLYIQIGDIKNIKPDALYKDIVTYFKHVKKFNKVAVVSDENAAKNWAKLADPFIKADIKYFPKTESNIAKEWVVA